MSERLNLFVMDVVRKYEDELSALGYSRPADDLSSEELNLFHKAMSRAFVDATARSYTLCVECPIHGIPGAAPQGPPAESEDSVAAIVMRLRDFANALDAREEIARANLVRKAADALRRQFTINIMADFLNQRLAAPTKGGEGA